MSDKAFDKLRTFAAMWAPATVAIGSILTLLKVPNASVITAIIAVLTTLLNAEVHILRVKYNKNIEDYEKAAGISDKTSSLESNEDNK